MEDIESVSSPALDSSAGGLTRGRSDQLEQWGKNQAGSGTALASLVAFGILALIVGLGVILVMVVGGQRARNVADLTAVSAALAFDSSRDACEVARQVAVANQAEVDECRVHGDSIDFAVSVTVHLPGYWPFVGRAVAGHLEPD